MRAIVRRSVGFRHPTKIVFAGFGRDLWRSKPLPSPQIEQEWSSSVPEITKPQIQEPIFKDGGEYRYLYDGQILTGLPDIHQQYSGVRVRAIVKIQLGSKDLMQVYTSLFVYSFASFRLLFRTSQIHSTEFITNYPSLIFEF